jgi:micrococcal nuclease
MYEYRVKVLKIVDGDTVDVDIDLGFGIVLKDERVRLMGIDTPESRTRDKVEKQFGLAAKKRVKQLLGGKSGPILKTQINKKGEDMKGKFGRILGDFSVYDGNKDAWRPLTELLVEEGHAVAYFGGDKDEIDQKHLANRSKLIREGIVNMTAEQAGISDSGKSQ